MKNKNITCAFIFARKGSEGLKNKNIKKINNKFLFEYSILIAKKLKVDEIIVSSNITQIENYCKKNKIFFIKRPEKLASAKSAEILAWKHALLEYEKKKNKKIDIFLSLPIVTPVKKISNIRKSIQIIKKKKYDLVVSVTKSEASPNFNLFKKMGDRLGLFNNIKKTYRRQNNHYYFVVPNFYVAKRKYVLSTNHIFNGKIFPMEIPRKYTFDINDNYDFQILKFLIENKKL